MTAHKPHRCTACGWRPGDDEPALVAWWWDEGAA